MTPLGGPVLTAADMRAAEAACGIPLAELMERAGAALAEAAWRFGNGAPVLVLCGPGNNGGDGYVAARLLAAHGLCVRVAASGPSATDLAKNAAALWTGPVETLDASSAPVLVDALFGTGLTRPLAPGIRDPFHRLTKAARFVIAADLPSGVSTAADADLRAAKTNLTLAFAAAKPAHLLQPSASLCGRVMIADIGIGIGVASEATVLARPDLPTPGPADHKYTRGYVL
nr:NAD(P)H-hydrate epimerase [Sphingomonadaceae bacterium]